MFFTKFHENKEDAIAEASRLAAKEDCQFYVLRVFAIVKPEIIVPPVKIIYMD